MMTTRINDFTILFIFSCIFSVQLLANGIKMWKRKWSHFSLRRYADVALQRIIINQKWTSATVVSTKHEKTDRILLISGLFPLHTKHKSVHLIAFLFHKYFALVSKCLNHFSLAWPFGIFVDIPRPPSIGPIESAWMPCDFDSNIHLTVAYKTQQLFQSLVRTDTLTRCRHDTLNYWCVYPMHVVVDLRTNPWWRSHPTQIAPVWVTPLCQTHRWTNSARQ